MLRWLWLSLVVVIFDQVSKQLVESSFLVFEVMPLLPSLNLTLVYNEGAAFSFLSDQGGWQRWFFILIGLMVSLVLVIWISRLTVNQRLSADCLKSGGWWCAGQYSGPPAARSCGRFHRCLLSGLALAGIQCRRFGDHPGCNIDVGRCGAGGASARLFVERFHLKVPSS